MIIQFTGSHSTGKTTVSEILEQRYSFTAQREIARYVHSQGLPINSKATNFSQCYMNSLLLSKFMQFQAISLRNFVFDRSFICCYAYSKLAGLHSALLEHTLDLIKLTSSPPYASYTFYFPLTISFTPDGVREQDTRELVDQYIREALDLTGISYITVPDTSAENRAHFIIQNIQGSL